MSLLKVVYASLLVPMLLLFALLQHAASAVVHDKRFSSETTNVSVVVLEGTMSEMGVQYGTLLKKDLAATLQILLEYYRDQKGFSEAQIAQQADKFFTRFPSNIQSFVKGMAQGANISFDNAKTLHAMETLGELSTDDALGQCLFGFTTKTPSGTSLFARNYDYGKPFDQISEHLVVAFLKEVEGNVVHTPVALITMPGQIYCPSCLNANGLFMEMNNGMPSGGFVVDYSATSLLSDMMTSLQRYGDSLASVSQYLHNLKKVDFSLIVNVGDATTVTSYEFSTNTTLGMRPDTPPPGENFVVTNYFLNTTWGPLIPQPNDINSWLGVTRRNNMLALLEKTPKSSLDITALQGIMETNIASGGSVWINTIYQILYDSSTKCLYIKPRKADSWTVVKSGEIFARM